MDELKQPFYTLQEVADLLKVNIQTIRRKVREGKLKAYRMGRGYRVSREYLEEFLESMKEY